MNYCILIRFKLHILLILLVLMLQGLPSASASAQTNAGDHLAVILILDDSGSMKTSDPTDLRYTAAQLFVSLFKGNTSRGSTMLFIKNMIMQRWESQHDLANQHQPHKLIPTGNPTKVR